MIFSVFDHFVGLGLKELVYTALFFLLLESAVTIETWFSVLLS